MKVFQIVLTLSFVSYLICKESSTHNSNDKKRALAGVPAIVGAALVAGANIAGTAAKGLRYDTFISASGTIDNFSKWTLQLKRCTLEDGYMNAPMRSIHPGFREGFASHYVPTIFSADALTDLPGSKVYCKFETNTPQGKYLVYIHYNIPHSQPNLVFNHAQNSLGFAVCKKTESECASLSAGDMENGNLDYTGYRLYDSTTAHLVACGDVLCIDGLMGTSRKSKIDIKMYPKSYSDLSSAVNTQTQSELQEGDYRNYIQHLQEEARKK